MTGRLDGLLTAVVLADWSKVSASLFAEYLEPVEGSVSAEWF